MINRRLLLFICFVCLFVTLLMPGRAAADPVSIDNGDGMLLGDDRSQVGVINYDTSFLEVTFNTLFPSHGPGSVRPFGNILLASAASQPPLDPVRVDKFTDNFARDPSKVDCITYAQLRYLTTPFEVVSDGNAIFVYRYSLSKR